MTFHFWKLPQALHSYNYFFIIMFEGSPFLHSENKCPRSQHRLPLTSRRARKILCPSGCCSQAFVSLVLLLQKREIPWRASLSFTNVGPGNLGHPWASPLAERAEIKGAEAEGRGALSVPEHSWCALSSLLCFFIFFLVSRSTESFPTALVSALFCSGGSALPWHR